MTAARIAQLPAGNGPAGSSDGDVPSADTRVARFKQRLAVESIPAALAPPDRLDARQLGAVLATFSGAATVAPGGTIRIGRPELSAPILLDPATLKWRAEDGAADGSGAVELVSLLADCALLDAACMLRLVLGVRRG